MRPYLLINPQGIDLEGYVNEHAPELDLHYLRYLLHYVICGMSRNIEKQKTNPKAHIEQPYTFICSTSIIHKHKLRPHIRFLGKCFNDGYNLLFRSNYSKGRCYSYTLSDHIMLTELKSYELKDFKLAKAMRKDHCNIHNVVESPNGKYHYLHKYFNSEDLTIQIDLALELCEERYAIHQNYFKYLSEYAQLIKLHNGSYYISYKAVTDARIHTSLTSLPKVYRKFLKYKGKQLAEVDLSNSIIFFIAMCLSNRVNDSILKSYPLLYMFTKCLESADAKEIKLFFQLSVDGTFYDAFIPEFLECYSKEEMGKHYRYYYKAEYDESFKHQRNIVKRLLLSMLFAKNGSKPRVERIFESKFPTILKAIKGFKRDKGYKKLSHMVFQLEAETMLNVVGRAFNKKYYRKAPLFTLHDCLITTVDHIPQLETLMMSEFEKFFGIAPKMDSKTW